jgi:metal-sulfur cluster biosynthetic enzyme
MGLVESVTVKDGAVTVRLRLTTPGCLMVEHFQREVDVKVGSLPGVRSVELETDAGYTWMREMMTDAAREKRARQHDELAARYEGKIDEIFETESDGGR